MGYFRWENLELRYEPFPIGLIRPVFEHDKYSEFVEAFPQPVDFLHISEFGSKYSLSEKFNHRKYAQFVSDHPLWREFHRWIKSRDFIEESLQALRKRHIDLGASAKIGLGSQFTRLLGAVGRRSTRIPHRLRARFEFAMLPAAGGNVLPHTDSPGKIITFVISIVKPGEWDCKFGGGTDVNRALTPELQFNYRNRQARFDDMEVLHTYEFTPNQAVVFVKTFNSWHSVRPMTGSDPAVMRKTLTINIEEF